MFINLLSPLLVVNSIDWVMKTTTVQGRNSIRWNLWSQLDDLNFAEDLAFLAHTQQEMQTKTTLLMKPYAK